MAAVTKAASSRLDPTFRPEVAMLFNLSRFYGSKIGVALVIFAVVGIFGQFEGMLIVSRLALSLRKLCPIN